MSSPLSPRLANTFLSRCKKYGLMSLFYRCYVDDIFVLFKSKSYFKLFVNCMNSKHKNIKFIFEAEGLNNFSCLNVKTTRKNKRFVNLIFHKATFSRVFNNYNSFIFDT